LILPKKIGHAFGLGLRWPTHLDHIIISLKVQTHILGFIAAVTGSCAIGHLDFSKTTQDLGQNHLGWGGILENIARRKLFAASPAALCAGATGNLLKHGLRSETSTLLFLFALPTNF